MRRFTTVALILILVAAAAQAERTRVARQETPSLLAWPPRPNNRFFIPEVYGTCGACSSVAGMQAAAPYVDGIQATGSPAIQYVSWRIIYGDFVYVPPLPAAFSWHEFRPGDQWCAWEYSDQPLSICAARFLETYKTIYRRTGLVTTTDGTLWLYWFND